MCKEAPTNHLTPNTPMRLLTSLLACFVALAASAAVEIGKPAPEFTAKDKDGKTVSLSDFKGKTVVLEWYNPGCPYVKKFYDVGAMQNAQKDAIGQGVVWLVINSGGHKLNEANGYYPANVINDEGSKIARAYEAKVTPHCFVIDAKGNLAYKGAIDSIPSAKSADIEKATNYVAAALKSLKDGKAPETTTTKPYGCGVKY